jgi:hypothetical protein
LVRREEIILRSGSMGEFVFSAPGTNERLLEASGFVDVRVEDVTENLSSVAAVWRAGRERHADELERIKGVEPGMTCRSSWPSSTRWRASGGSHGSRT